MAVSLSMAMSTRRHAVGAFEHAAPSFINISCARDLHGGELAKPLPQPFHLALAHRALLGEALVALGEVVELAVLGQELDLNALADLLPGLVDQMFLKPGQPSFGRADQVLHRGIALTHLGEDLFGWDAAVHHPNAPRLAVLRLDLGEEAPQRLVVAGVAGHDLVGERQAVRRHDECDHHLWAVRPLVPAVAVATLVALGLRRGVDFEVGAGQVVEQHVEAAGVEQIAPAGDPMAEQLLLVGQQTVVTGIELVRFGQGEVRAQQIGHGALFRTSPRCSFHSLPGAR